MANNNSSTQSGGIGFFGLLTIVFITLKLTDYIAWSWWWVLSPLWAPLAVVLAIGLIALVVLGFIKVFK
jgi:hypothetical protein